VGRLHTRYAPVRRSSPDKSGLPLDLHVLGLPLAFILSQDQTLHCISSSLIIPSSPPAYLSSRFCSKLDLRSAIYTSVQRTSRCPNGPDREGYRPHVFPAAEGFPPKATAKLKLWNPPSKLFWESFFKDPRNPERDSKNRPFMVNAKQLPIFLFISQRVVAGLFTLTGYRTSW
jgi:hypothetical protein